MAWLQLRIRSDRGSAPRLESLLEQAGAVSVALADGADQPLFEPGPGETPLWDEVLITALYPADTDAGEVIAALRHDWGPSLPPVQADTLEDQDWERAWMDDFRPMRFGRRLWICPSWSDVPDNAAVTIRLDPGLAFGTGTHPTTALCLEWLDAHPVSGRILVDYGCGSGILGIAALKLGARRIHGIDNDPQALTATRDNCRKNGISADRFPVYSPDDFAATMAAGDAERGDVVLANILAEPLLALPETLARVTRPEGWLLLSGILTRQGNAIETAYRPWFEFKGRAEREGWIRLDAIRKRE